MARVKIKVIRVVDDSFPEFVECELLDAEERIHKFFEKAPVVFAQQYDGPYPTEATIRCTIIKSESMTSTICTNKPDGIESTGGLRIFRVSNRYVVDA